MARWFWIPRSRFHVYATYLFLSTVAWLVLVNLGGRALGAAFFLPFLALAVLAVAGMGVSALFLVNGTALILQDTPAKPSIARDVLALIAAAMPIICYITPLGAAVTDWHSGEPLVPSALATFERREASDYEALQRKFSKPIRIVEVIGGELLFDNGLVGKLYNVDIQKDDMNWHRGRFPRKMAIVTLPPLSEFMQVYRPGVWGDAFAHRWIDRRFGTVPVIVTVDGEPLNQTARRIGEAHRGW